MRKKSESRGERTGRLRREGHNEVRGEVEIECEMSESERRGKE